MAHPVGASSNSLFSILEEWNAILQHTSLGRGNLKAANDGKDEDAPRAAIRAGTPRGAGGRTRRP